MKRTIIGFITSAILLVAAWLVPHSLFSVEMQAVAPTDAAGGNTAILPGVDAAGTPVADPAVTSTPSIPGDLQVGYDKLFFSIPAGLASGAEGVTGPAVTSEPGFYSAADAPAFTQLTLLGYPFHFPDGVYQPEVRVYPAAEYAKVSLWAAESLKRLQSVLANPGTPLTNDTLPNVAFRGSAGQLYAAQVKMLPFMNGKGVRMISAYAQFPAAVSQYDSFYHYEGLTQDGKYYVIVEMPVVLPVYSDGSNPGENGITYPADRVNPDEMVAYYKATTDLLNNANTDGFNPTLGQLDALVQSISVMENK